MQWLSLPLHYIKSSYIGRATINGPNLKTIRIIDLEHFQSQLWLLIYPESSKVQGPVESLYFLARIPWSLPLRYLAVVTGEVNLGCFQDLHVIFVPVHTLQLSTAAQHLPATPYVCTRCCHLRLSPAAGPHLSGNWHTLTA